MAPSRKDLFKSLSLVGPLKDEIILKDIKVFKENLFICVSHLVTFYAEHDLENHERVWLCKILYTKFANKFLMTAHE